MTLDELATYLASAGLGLTVGTNLFKGPLPESSATEPAVGMVPYFGARQSEPAFGATALVFEWPRLQVTVRGARDGYQAAQTLAEGVYKALGAVSAATLSGTFYHQVRCLQPPFFLKYDANARPTLAINVEVEKRVSA